MSKIKGEVDPIEFAPPWLRAAKQYNVPDEVVQMIYRAGMQEGANQTAGAVLAAIGLHPEQLKAQKEKSPIIEA